VVCRTYKEGDELCDASQVADTIYIVHEGQAQVCVKGAAVTTLDQGFSIGTAEVLRSFREFTDSSAKVKNPKDSAAQKP
jgi:CRP-like cAMP-binding protein